MDITELDRIKKLTIIAMFQDDDLLDTLVLKGGNALDIVYKISPRGSIDLDFSIEREFHPEQMNSIQGRISNALKKISNEYGYEIFDITFREKPEKPSPEIPNFWGGYEIEFKIIPKAEYAKMVNDVNALRHNAKVVGPDNRKKFRIDISKCEYCKQKTQIELDNYTVYVYTPEMIVFEKLRAICQQMHEYANVFGKSHTDARARDFFDIYTVIEHFKIDVVKPQNIKLLKNVFAAKQVPLELLGKIINYREHHRPDFPAVKDTVKKGITIEPFDYYFDYVVNKSNILLEALGIK